ncbi:response regulator [Arenimonas sp. MALMAid1274]|uniref:response regulator transcription factor n=1 Tax=Arenimonas sp. MALMAid1274 TaxID=3411630 RepID=UPI003B9EC957
MNSRVLLLEDDAVSAAFLDQALAPLGLQVQWAGDLATARRLVDDSLGLWLFDARLPDGHAADLLPELRARGWTTPALALTASEDPVELQRLARAGFAEVLSKPIGSRSLQAAVQRHLQVPCGVRAAWDDEAALLALGGQPASVQALRQLFLQELPGQRDAALHAVASDDLAGLQALLHRLKASCGFVGAAALAEAVRALAAAPRAATALARFQADVEALLVAPPPTPAAVAPVRTASPTT